MAEMQTLLCTHAGGTHSWHRVAQRGRPPFLCPFHAEQEGKSPKAQPKPEPKAQEEPQEAPKAPEDTPEEEMPRENLRHRMYPTLRKVMSQNVRQVPAWLAGPAGSGKTTAGRQIASELGLPFYAESCNPGMSAWDLMGFMDASGRYVPGICREAVENGGVLLLDEIDAATPDVLVSINLLAASTFGDIVRFRDGAQVPIHPSFRLIGCGNTVGDGASESYVGRQQIDAATLSRFAMIEWDYDEELERAFSPVREWTEYVQRVRGVARELRIDTKFCTPRASENGGYMLKAGLSRRQVEDLFLWNILPEDDKRAVKSALRRAEGVAA